MFPKNFLIAYDLLVNKLSDIPIERADLVLYVQTKFNCTEMFYNKIQTKMNQARLIATTLEKVDGKVRRTKKLIKVKDVSVFELYELLCGPYPLGDIEAELKPVLLELSTRKAKK